MKRFKSWLTYFIFFGIYIFQLWSFISITSDVIIRLFFKDKVYIFHILFIFVLIFLPILFKKTNLFLPYLIFINILLFILNQQYGNYHLW